MGVKKHSIAIVSGGFDPVHVGHIRLFNGARRLTKCDELWVIMNNDNWLTAKKGFVFMPEQERIVILESLKSVDKVLLSLHENGDTRKDVGQEIEYLASTFRNYDFTFCNGGDRGNVNTPETKICDELGWGVLFGVGGTVKLQSSSLLVKKANGKKNGFDESDKGGTWEKP